MIREIPASERPRERCLEKGPESLSLRECLALLLHSGPRGGGSLGLAQELLDRPGRGLSEREQERALFTALEATGAAHLMELSGLGDACRARLLAAFELARRYAVHRDRSRPFAPGRAGLRFRPRDPQEWALEHVDPARRAAAHEWLGFVPYYRAQGPGELCIVERGARTHVNVDPAELFARILALRPAGFHLFHNHPSGDLTPSPSDFDLTHRVAQVARSLGISLLGHAIVTPNGERWIDVL